MPRKSKTATNKTTTKVAKTTNSTTTASATTTTTKTAKTQSGGRAPNPWLVHVKKVKAENPDLKFKEVLLLAKESYTKVKKA